MFDQTPIKIEWIDYSVFQKDLLIQEENQTKFIGITKQFARRCIAQAITEDNSRICILFFPDLEKLWRTRKKVNSKSRDLKDELFLTQLSLQIAPKCGETWSYRRFLLKSQGKINANF